MSNWSVVSVSDCVRVILVMEKNGSWIVRLVRLVLLVSHGNNVKFAFVTKVIHEWISIGTAQS